MQFNVREIDEIDSSSQRCDELIELTLSGGTANIGGDEHHMRAMRRR